MILNPELLSWQKIVSITEYILCRCSEIGAPKSYISNKLCPNLSSSVLPQQYCSGCFQSSSSKLGCPVPKCFFSHVVFILSYGRTTFNLQFVLYPFFSLHAIVGGQNLPVRGGMQANIPFFQVGCSHLAWLQFTSWRSLDNGSALHLQSGCVLLLGMGGSNT